MSIRTKFLLTLLVFTLLPLMVVTFINLKSYHKQGTRFAQRANVELGEIVRQDLLHTVQDYAYSLEKGELSLWFGVKSLANAATNALAPELNSDGASTFLSSDFDSEATRPPDSQPDPRFSFTGRPQLLTSRQHQAFLLDPRVTRAEAARDMCALATLMPMQKDLEKMLGDMAFRQYICLRSGVCSIYPGHGHFPKEFSPLDQSWYRETLRRGELHWHGPVFDSSLGIPIFFLARPIFDNDGLILGVAAVDAPLSEFLRSKRIFSQWGEQLRSFLVNMRVNPDTGARSLTVMVSQPNGATFPKGAADHEVISLDSEDQAGLQALLRSMENNGSGVVELPYHGESSIWAYSRYPGPNRSKDNFIVLILPMSVFQELPDEFTAAVMKLTKRQVYIAMGALILVAGIVIIASFWFARIFTRPLITITSAARRLSEGDFDVRLDVEFTDERQEMVRVINELGPKLAAYMNVQQALEVAEEIQKNLLPKHAPSIPGFQVSGVSLYSDETGGDYFDFLLQSPERGGGWSAIIGDVSGHGLPSALLMATARALLRGLSVLPMTLSERVTMVNKLLTEDLYGSGRFMTLFILEFGAKPGMVRWIRAGHDPALIYDPATDEFEELLGDGAALGVLDDWVYIEYEHAFNQPDGIIILGTDGIWETMDEHRRMFGKDRLREVIRKNAAKSAGAIQDAILSAVNDFRGQAEQADDITISVIKKLKDPQQ